MLQFRIDVDYPYSSRWRSFLSVFLRIKIGEGYLENAKAIARMMNDSPKDILAFWFFTFQTIPDREMTTLLTSSKHMIGLHVVSDAEKELALFYKYCPNAEIKYYNFHGVERLMSRVIWHKVYLRNVPLVFPLCNFAEDQTCVPLDRLCYSIGTTKKILEITSAAKIISIHPEWLTQYGTINQRGKYKEVLQRILDA